MGGERLTSGSSLPAPAQREHWGWAPSCWQSFPCYSLTAANLLTRGVCACVSTRKDVLFSRKSKMTSP